MAINIEKLDQQVAKGFYIAKKKGKNGIIITRIHPDEKVKYEKEKWTVEIPVSLTDMPEEK